MTEATIRVRFRRQGWHCWPVAPAHRAYLRNLHRHMFWVEVRTTVTDDDREIEFHDLKDEAERLFAGLSEDSHAFGRGVFGPLSCEMMARKIAAALSEKHGRGRRFTVAVWEDGECGAEVTI